MIKVELKVIEGKNLKGKDFGGLSSDPFCKVITAQGTQQTQVCKLTRNPQWNRSFMLQLQRGEEIRFEVYDYDTFGKNDFLGFARYKVLDGRPGQTIDTWLSLSKKGEIHIQIVYQGMPVAGVYPGAVPMVAGARHGASGDLD